MARKEIKLGENLQTADGKSVSVVWASGVAKTEAQKREGAKQLRQALGQRHMWDSSNLDGQVRHERQHALGTRKPTQYLIVDQQGKFVPATVSTKRLNLKETIVMALAPDDPQMDDRLLAHHAQKRLRR